MVGANRAAAERGHRAGDKVTFREFNDAAARYTNTPPITFKIVTVTDHYSDRSTIPFGCFLLHFEPIPPVVNPPVVQYVLVPKDKRIVAKTSRRLIRNWPLPLR